MDGAGAAAPHSARFIGRSAERTLLRHLLHQAGRGQLAIVVVSGVPGAGKTALLEWTADSAKAFEAEVLWASGYESSLPFAALSRLVAPLRELSDVIPAPRSRGPVDDELGHTNGAATTGSLPRVIVDALLRRARRRLLVIILDDVQDLGDASRAVLGDALVGIDDAGARQRLQLLVVLSARSPLEPEGFAGRALRLRAARTVSLGGFNDQEALEFLASAGWRPGRSAVRELLDQTGGLPLLVESAVHQRDGTSVTFGAEGHGRAIDGRVRSISDALRLRFDRIDDTTRHTLQRAAVLGDPWSLRELAAVTERTASELDSMIGAAERANLVDRHGQTVRFAHPLVRSELLDRLAAAETAEIHRSIATRLGTLHGSGGPMNDAVQIRIADHLLRAEPDVESQDVADQILSAGRIAMRWTAYDQAARFLTAAARSAIGVASDAEVATRFLEAGRAAYYDYDHDLAESLLAEAISHARRAGDDGVRLTAATTLTRMRGSKRARPQDDVDVTELREALSDHGDVDLDVLVQAEAALAEVLIGSRRGDAAESILASARRSAAGVGSDRSIADALGRLDFAAGVSKMTMLDLHAANDLFDEALRNALKAGNPLTTVMARSRRVVVGLMRGSIGRAHDELVEVIEQTSAHGFWGETGLAASLLAFAEVVAGREGAVDRAEEAHRHWQRTRNPWNGAILAAIGPVLAARAAREPRRAPGATSMWANPLGASAPSVSVALAAVESHDVRAARRVLESASWRGGVRGPPTLNSLVVAAALVEVGDLVSDSTMVSGGFVALQPLDERGVRITLPWPALTARLLAVGCRHVGDLEEANRHLRAAFELAEREGLAPERAKCTLERARIAAAAGERGEAAEAMAEAVRLFDDESMHGWIARCDEIGRRLQLPPAVGSSGLIRERTILTNDVVGSTLSNARLGDVLYLEQLRVHDRILRERLREFRGVETKHTGDGLTIVFNDPADAARCALAAQRDFEAWNRDEPELALRIRCGLAHGPLVPSGGDFYGLVQSAAARVCSLAGAGEVLATARVVDDCPADVVAISLGFKALRGLPEDVEVFQLTERVPGARSQEGW